MSSPLATLRQWLARGPRPDAPAPAERWVVIDTETAGLDPDRHPLLAIGAVAVDDTGILVGDSFEIVLRREAEGDAENIAVHGIGHGAQAAGTDPATALAAFRDWAAGAPRVAFHADFDRAVLRNAFAHTGVPDAAARWLDLAPLAAALALDADAKRGRSLDEWLDAYGIECTLRHNAAADALSSAELLLTLRAIAARQGRAGFDALVRTARQQKWLGGGN
jgi:DNA polymerase-3 subunit epsilon